MEENRIDLLQQELHSILIRQRELVEDIECEIVEMSDDNSERNNLRRKHGVPYKPKDDQEYVSEVVISRALDNILNGCTNEQAWIESSESLGQDSSSVIELAKKISHSKTMLNKLVSLKEITDRGRVIKSMGIPLSPESVVTTNKPYYVGKKFGELVTLADRVEVLENKVNEHSKKIDSVETKLGMTELMLNETMNYLGIETLLTNKTKVVFLKNRGLTNRAISDMVGVSVRQVTRYLTEEKT